MALAAGKYTSLQELTASAEGQAALQMGIDSLGMMRLPGNPADAAFEELVLNTLRAFAMSMIITDHWTLDSSPCNALFPSAANSTEAEAEAAAGGTIKPIYKQDPFFESPFELRATRPRRRHARLHRRAGHVQGLAVHPTFIQ